MWHIVSTQPIFITVITFITHQCTCRDNQVKKSLRKISAILYKLISVAILNAFTSSFGSGSYYFFLLDTDQYNAFHSS